MKLPHALSQAIQYSATQEITTILTLLPRSLTNKGILRRAQFYKDKQEKDESNIILEAENQMDKLDITWRSRTELVNSGKLKPS